LQEHLLSRGFIYGYTQEDDDDDIHGVAPGNEEGHLDNNDKGEEMKSLLDMVKKMLDMMMMKNKPTFMVNKTWTPAKITSARTCAHGS
jgi:hypothetical protein